MGLMKSRPIHMFRTVRGILQTGTPEGKGALHNPNDVLGDPVFALTPFQRLCTTVEVLRSIPERLLSLNPGET